ncbi:MAG: L,D-transpeptidase family protein [Erythrobacter sp.]
MNRALVFLVAVTVMPFAASAQRSPSDVARAAEAAAVRVSGTFEAIDPDSEMPASDEASAAYAGLPPLDSAMPDPASAPIPAVPMIEEDTLAAASTTFDADLEAPRGPAVRMIDSPVVQSLPPTAAVNAIAPTPITAPVAAPVATAAPTAIASNSPFVIKSILPIEGTIRYGDWFWDESAAPATGTLVITVDLDARVISAFRDGHEIGTAVALLGTQSHPTPIGTFPILTKERDNVSEKYKNAPMPYTLRLTWAGIAIHGSPVMNGYASHGCIGVPDDFAAKLFAVAKRGDKVIITRGRMIGVGDKVM